jgi:hypothetical protein
MQVGHAFLWGYSQKRLKMVLLKTVLLKTLGVPGQRGDAMIQCGACVPLQRIALVVWPATL